MESQKLVEKVLSLSNSEKIDILKEKIIYIDFILSSNTLLLLSSNNIIYICQTEENSIKITKKLLNIINNSEININMCHFCNEDKNVLLLFCDDYNIYEYNIDRAYISHIYYNILENQYLFKMNCQKNSNPQNGIKNFGIFKEGELKIWNSLLYNKSNVLCIQDIKCFSYDCTGVVIYVLGKSSKSLYYLSVIKFINEYECKEIYFKILNFIEVEKDINYLDLFDNNIIMSDREFGKIYILKNYPINKFDFISTINKNNIIPPLLFPFIGENRLYQFGILYINFNDKSQKIINICYMNSNISYKDINIDLKEDTPKYFKESTNGKSLLLIFDDLKKELKNYLI